MRTWLAILLVAIVLAPAARGADETAPPRLAKERVILSTDYGDLVLALYPDIAPRHVEQILKLVRLGAYDTTRFFRIEPGFIIQLSHIQDRIAPLTREQADGEQNLPAEFSSTLRHRLGSLSMARWDDPNSARSSFSILLGNAPHLDGQYTLFGHVESGGSVLQSIANVPRRDTTPIKRITIRQARIDENIDAYYAQNPFDPVVPVIFGDSGLDIEQKSIESQSALLFVLGAIIVISLAGYFLYPRLNNKHLLALLMLTTLISSFGLLILTLPLAGHYAWLSTALFFGLFGLFKLMSRFENR